MQEPAPDVHRIHPSSPTTQENIGKPAGGCADVCAYPACRIDSETIERGRQLQRATAGVIGPGFDGDGRVLAHGTIRPAHCLAGHPHLAGKDQRLRPLT